MYQVEVSKLVGHSWSLVPENTFVMFGRTRDQSPIVVPESRLTLRGSMELVRQCVQFCRKHQGVLNPAVDIGVS